MKSFVAWLRGINVGAAGRGRKSVPMAELRALAEELGLREPRTYVQSGNVVFAASGSATAYADALEAGIERRFGFRVPVVVSPEQDVLDALRACPFADAAEERPNLVHVGFCRAKVARSAVAALEEAARGGERVAVAAGHLWIDFASGVARSKLTPAVLDRALGAPVTMRNVNTLRAVAGMLRG